MLTPAFHFRILESFIPIIQKQQTIMMKIIETKVRESNDRTIDDIKPLITNCALDIICGNERDRLIQKQIFQLFYLKKRLQWAFKLKLK